MTCLLDEELHEGFAFVGDASVEDGVFEVLFQYADFAGGRQLEQLHDFVAVDDGLAQGLVQDRYLRLFYLHLPA